MTIEERRKRIAELHSEIGRAHAELARAQRELVQEEYALRYKNVDIAALDADQLREHVADCARDHGAECTDAKRVDTTTSWLLFRRALAELARRAGATR